jgi:hypothetical protein
MQRDLCKLNPASEFCIFVETGFSRRLALLHYIDISTSGLYFLLFRRRLLYYYLGLWLERKL